MPLSLDRDLFAREGLIKLEQVVPLRETAYMKAWIYSELSRMNLGDKQKLISSKIRDLPVFQQTLKLGEMIKLDSSIERLFTDDLLKAVSELFGHSERRESSSQQPQLLLSFPHKLDWSLNKLNWHLDLKVPQKDELQGVQAFILIDDVRPHAGGTLALMGSHKLPYCAKGQTANAIHLLRQHADFSRLFEGNVDNHEYFFEPHFAHGIEVSVREMTGKAGDVYLMDMRVLHSPSVNASRNLRMMVTQRFFKTPLW